MKKKKKKKPKELEFLQTLMRCSRRNSLAHSWANKLIDRYALVKKINKNKIAITF